MYRDRAGRFNTFCLGLLVLLVSAVGSLRPSLVYGQAASRPAGKELLPLKNGQFAKGDDAEQPVADWKFESLTLEPTSEQTRVMLKVGSEGEAKLIVPEDGKGVLLEGTTDTARGDLISSPLNLRPFRWVSVTVRYKGESGEPLMFVCLRPTADRSHVDLAFLSKPSPGKIRKSTVMLHTGSLEGEYSISVSIVGEGTGRFRSIEASEAGDFTRPNKPVLIVDFLDWVPAADGKREWSDAEKLVTVFGFSKLEYIHFTEFTKEKLEAADPALVIISPGGDNLRRLDRQKSIEAANILLEHYDGPLLGICLGHQLLAMVIENQGLQQISEWGATGHRVTRKDPIFKGLPRYPRFTVSESHNSAVVDVPDGAEVIAKSKKVPVEVLRFREKPWYTFQAHIEREWEYACPEAYILWQNMLRKWKLAPAPPTSNGRQSP